MRSVVVASAVAVVVALVAVWLALRDDVSGDAIRERGPFSRYRTCERLRWNGSVAFTLARSTAVPETWYNSSDPDFAATLMERWKPVVVKGSPVLSWKALRKWKDASYVAVHLPVIKAHAPSAMAIRMHHDNQPLGDLPGVNWTRPWLEHMIHYERLARGDKVAYFMTDARKLAEPLRRDLYPTASLSLSWRPALELNLWIGTTGVTTPAHFDMAHNFYAQIVGNKRFILWPPSDEAKLYTFTRLHPSAHQTQIDLCDAPEHIARHFPLFASGNPLEVVLEPGDVLFIPAFWFHHVTVTTARSGPAAAAENALSVSASVHSACDEVDMRVDMIEASLKLPMQDAWSLAEKACYAMLHVRALFLSDAEMVMLVNSVLAASYSHWHMDDGAVGLWDLIRDARKAFPTDGALNRTCADIARHSPVVEQFIRLGEQVRSTVNNAHGVDIITNMLHSYMQDTAGLVLGPLYVDPFLRWIAREFAHKRASRAVMDAPVCNWRVAILLNKVDEVVALLDSGLSPTHMDHNGMSPLGWALDVLDDWPWTYEVSTLLMSHAPNDVVVREDVHSGKGALQPQWRSSTALGRAIFNRDAALVAHMLQCFRLRLDVVETDERDGTRLPALALAVECDDEAVCRELLLFGASLHRRYEIVADGSDGALVTTDALTRARAVGSAELIDTLETFAAHAARARSATLAVLGAARHSPLRDVMGLVARSVWAQRYAALAARSDD